MLILLNENNVITSYATVGSLENGFQINDELLPNDLKTNFEPYKYKLEDGRIILNEDYKPIPETNVINTPSNTRDEDLWQMVANLQVQNVQSNMIAQQALQKVDELENRGVSNDQS
ncbi:DUF2977 domain-containing protein [Staphylococcus saprophyticus]|uniref:DUF2977 domain-containing protein n=1 Tax=Staphylococcus saprophyticus TaxID=29385 RepID=UPI00085357F6|nr:DUF2977 domain-containing protein [Staphylococcus saprophyticus]MDW3871256.1 DUF2977 domain-containing protein [Staphylococcus saprophyticus]MDW4026238.1 DUF2977 domain-containing protein [Staphylococcus saprophyticus]OEK40126.1 hypothetical protein ASS89_08535 [Staphylococcus saprophyticus]